MTFIFFSLLLIVLKPLLADCLGTSLSNITSLPETYATWLLQRGNKNYDHSKLFGMNSEIAFHWKIKNGRLYIAAAVEASGWLGFGLAEVGGMPGADVILFTASDNKLVDAHATDYAAPIEDQCQDWTLEYSTVNLEQGFLIFEASRELITGDPKDRNITDDSNPSAPSQRVIFAYGDTPSVSYHGKNVGLGSLRFFAPNDGIVVASESSFANENQASAAEIRSGNFTIPTNETTYQYFCFNVSQILNLSNISTTVHVYKMQFIPDVRSVQYVHHMILYGSFQENDCENTIYPLLLWAFGSEDFILPENVGIPIGGEGYKTLTLQMHYNNPESVSGVVDNSGVRLFYTENLRQFSAGVFQVGNPLADTSLYGEQVGEGYTNWMFSCPGTCSAEYFADQGNITVFNEILHMHGTGKRIVSSHIRNGNILREAFVDYYDFSMSGAHAIKQPDYEVTPGDSFQVNCYYDVAPSQNTTFGLGSQNEMCVAFHWYYPIIPKFHGYCGFNIYFDPACSGNYSNHSLSGEEDLQRVFGSKSKSCIAGQEVTVSKEFATSSSSSANIIMLPLPSLLIGFLTWMVVIL